MPLDANDPVGDVKDGLAEVWSALVPDPLKAVTDHEPRQAPDVPFLSIMTAGFVRRGLDDSRLSKSDLQDPLGGRIWVVTYSVRLWVDLSTDEVAAQVETDLLIPQVVRTLEGNRSLNGRVDDAAIETGDVGVVNDNTAGRPLVVTMMDCAVTWSEST